MPHDEPLRQRYLQRFAIGVVLLALLAVPVALHSYTAIETLFNNPSDWVPDSLPEKVEYNEFLRRFPISDLVMIAWEGSDLDTPELDDATKLVQPLCEDGYDPLTDDRMLADLPPWAGEDIRELRQVCGNPTPLRWARSGTDTIDQMTAAPANLARSVAVRRLQGSLVGPDGKQSCLIISAAESGMLQRRVLLARLRSMLAKLVDRPVDQVAIAGGPFDGAEVDASSIRSILVFSPPSAIVAAVLCLICLRSIPLTAVIVMVAVMGEGLAMASVYYTGTPMNAVLIVLPPLVFVLTVSSGIHLSNYYLDAAREFPDLSRVEAASRAMRAGVAPCLLATGTTVIGLGSLTLVRLEPIRIFGGVASLGVITTLLLLLLMLPGAMLLTRPQRRSTDEDQSGGQAGAFHRWLRTRARMRLARPWPLIVSFLIVTCVFATGLTRLETTVNVPRMFQPSSDIREQYAWFEQHVGPTMTGDLVLKFPPPGQDDDPLERLDLVKRAHLRAIGLENVDGVLSAMSFVPPIPRGRSLSATATRSVIRQLIEDPNSSLGRLNFISRDEQAEVWRVTVRIPQRETTDVRAEIESIGQTITAELADSELPVEVKLTGHMMIVQTSQQVLLRDLFRSFLAAFGIVAIVMMFLLRSPLGGLIAMLPNLFPTVALFGLMGLIRQPLDIGSVMTASVALGIAVDDTVHLLSRFGSRRARGIGQIRAAFGALRQCGWAMFQTTVVCGLSLMVYWFSDFVPTSRFAVLMFGLLSAALLGDVLLLPVLMSSPLGRWLARPVGADPAAEISADEDDIEPPQDIRRLPIRRSRHSQTRPVGGGRGGEAPAEPLTRES